MKPLKTYACINKNADIRMDSSSGAVFNELATYVINLKGIVYGVMMSEDCYSAVFTGVDKLDELFKLRGSKYLQACLGDTYKNVKQNLDHGQYVLFTGTGCQINGLKKFLKKDYDNLFCVDVICHGTPSPKVWEEYVKYNEEKHNGKLNYVNFRCKDDSWINFGMKESYKKQLDLNKEYISKDIDPYMIMFLSNYDLRPSCYHCRAKENPMSDMTIADFWGIEQVAPEMNDGRGTSLVLVRTEKGYKLFKSINSCFRSREVEYEDGVRANPSEYSSVAMPEERKVFFKDFYDLSFNELIKKYGVQKVSFKHQVKVKMKSFIMNTFKINRGGVASNNYNYGLMFVYKSK